MKRWLFTAVIVLLGCSFGWAQQQPDQSQGSRVQVGTVRGCLGGSDGNYMLTQDSSGTRFRLVGNDGDLKSHLGQEVLVTGQLPNVGTPPSAAGEADNGPATSSISGNIIQVSAVKTVSKTCSSGAQAPTSSY